MPGFATSAGSSFARRSTGRAASRPSAEAAIELVTLIGPRGPLAPRDGQPLRPALQKFKITDAFRAVELPRGAVGRSTKFLAALPKTLMPKPALLLCLRVKKLTYCLWFRKHGSSVYKAEDLVLTCSKGKK